MKANVSSTYIQVIKKKKNANGQQQKKKKTNKQINQQ